MRIKTDIAKTNRCQTVHAEHGDKVVTSYVEDTMKHSDESFIKTSTLPYCMFVVINDLYDLLSGRRLVEWIACAEVGVVCNAEELTRKQ